MVDMRTYRASSLGSCTKAQIALQLGYSPLATPDKVEGWYARGVDHEVECLEAMEAEGWSFADPMYPPEPWAVHDNQFYVELPVAGAVVTGHLDGIASHNRNYRHLAGDCVVEIKSPQSFHKWERAHKTGDYSDPLMNRYAWQISVYMAATGLEAVVACVEDGTVKTFGIEVAPFNENLIRHRVEVMEEYVELGTMPPCSQADYPCPVAYLHEKAEYEEDEALDTYVNLYARYAAEEKFAKGAKAEAQKALLMYLGERDGGETAESKVTRYSSTRTKFDMDKMRADGINVDMYAITTESESVRITKKEGGS